MKRPSTESPLSSIELFCLTAQHQSFTAAAQAAGVTPAAVSRAVQRLEARLGVRLLSRSTRSVRPTEAGERYYSQARMAMEQLAAAEREASGQQTQARGRVRLSLPTSYGHYRVLPLLPGFLRQHPGVELEVQLSNRNVDFVAEGYDLAIRGRAQPDSSLIARKLEDAALVIAASPEYLSRHGEPTTPEELAGHECLPFVLPSSGQTVPWLLCKAQRISEFEVNGRVKCTDDILGPVTLARAGAGLLQTYRFIVDAPLRSGELVEVMKPFAGASRPFSLLYPNSRHLPLRIRVLVEFLISRLAS